MIYAENAPKYHAKGLPAIPLIRGQKRPAINGWNRFCNEMPTESEMAAWRERYADGNIGIPLGKASGLVAVDIDTDVQWMIDGIQRLLPPSPWHRVGKKGLVMLYRYSGEKSFQIKDSSDGVIVEILSHNKQVVLPPSIHPDTKRPYEANCDLVDVIDDLPVLGPEVEKLLRGYFKENDVDLSVSGHTKMTEWVPSGARDVKMIEMAGLLAASVVRGEMTLLEAIGSLKSWAAGFVEKVAGDEVDIEKGLAKMVEFLSSDVRGKQRILPTGWDEGLTDEQKTQMGIDFDRDMEEWSVDELRDHLKKKFEEIPRTAQAKRTPVIEKVLQKLAFSPSISEIDAEQILQYIRDTSGTNIPMSTLRRRVREIARGDSIEGLNHEEIASAVLSDMNKIYQIKYSGEQFYRWDGSKWEPLEQSEIRRRISEGYGSLPAARRANDHRGIVDVLANKLTGDLKEVGDFEGVNFANGVVSRDLKLVPHKPEYGFTYTLKFRYMPDEARNCPRFLGFLNECWGKDEDYADKVSALQEAICATMFGIAPLYQRAFLCYGLPRTGKSVLLKIIRELVPDHGRCAVPPEVWNDKFSPAQMHNKVLNMCGELSESHYIEGNKFKEIVEGAEIQGQNKGTNIFRFVPKCAHWFGSNHLPKTKDMSDGFTRRWLIFTFMHPVPEEKMNRDLPDEIIREEREAIAAWALQAMPRLRASGDYTLCQSHKDQIEEVAEANNTVRFFIRKSGKVKLGSSDTKKPENLTTHNELYSAYSVFCGQALGVKRVGQPAFRNTMRELANQLGFQAHLLKNEMGVLEIRYSGLTLVD